jgi:hypothetical protein
VSFMLPLNEIGCHDGLRSWCDDTALDTERQGNALVFNSLKWAAIIPSQLR